MTTEVIERNDGITVIEIGIPGPQGPPGTLIEVAEDGVVAVTPLRELDFRTGFDITEPTLRRAQIDLDLSEVSAGGELAGTLDAPTVDALHSGSTHQSIADDLNAHEIDVVGAHNASAVAFTPTGTITSADTQSAVVEALTDAKTYTDDGHVILSSRRGAADGVAALDATGKVPSAELPAFSFGEVFTVASQAEMLALAATQGDMAVRTDVSKTFILSDDPATVLGNWVELLNPASPVTSVNTRTGSVTGLEEAANKGTAGGYASLDGSGTIPDAQIPSGVTRDSELPSFASPTIALGTAGATGSASSIMRSDATIPAFDATAPTTSAVGDSAATGSVAKAARRDHSHGREGFATPGSSALGDAAASGSATTLSRSDHLHGRESFATPTIALGTAAAAGSAVTPVRSDATIVAFDATVPTTQAFADSPAAGAAGVAARRDHKHGMPGRLFFDPADYNAAGNGVADDTTPLNNAAAAAAAAGGTLAYGFGKNYKITATHQVVCNTINLGAQITWAGGNGVAVALGDGATRYSRLSIAVPPVIQATQTWGGLDIGVKMWGMQDCDIDVRWVKNFSIGIDARGAASAPFVDNVIMLHHLENNKIGLNIDDGGSALGWCNECVWIKGHWHINSGEGTDISGCRQVKVTKSGTNVPNAHDFIGSDLEGSGPEYTVEVIGGSNINFRDCRWEGTPKVKLDAASDCNFAYGFNVHSIVFTEVNTPQRNHVYTRNFIAINGGGSSSGLFRLANASSSSNPIFQFYPAGTSPLTAAATAYTAAIGSAHLRYKQAGDSADRFHVSGSDGVLYWGSGTVADDVNLYRSAANTLKTDDDLVVGGTLTASGITGAVSSVAKSGATALTGAVTFSGGSGITLNEAGQNIEVVATGSAAANFLAFEKWGIS